MKSEKDKHHTISLTCGTIVDNFQINEVIYKTETDSQVWKISLCLPKVKWGDRGINWESGINSTYYYVCIMYSTVREP